MGNSCAQIDNLNKIRVNPEAFIGIMRGTCKSCAAVGKHTCLCGPVVSRGNIAILLSLAILCLICIQLYAVM